MPTPPLHLDDLVDGAGYLLPTGECVYAERTLDARGWLLRAPATKRVYALDPEQALRLSRYEDAEGFRHLIEGEDGFGAPTGYGLTDLQPLGGQTVPFTRQPARADSAPTAAGRGHRDARAVGGHGRPPAQGDAQQW